MTRSTPIYTMDPNAARVRCPDCGETRVRRGQLSAHRRDIGHPMPVRPDAEVSAETLELRLIFRASLARLGLAS